MSIIITKWKCEECGTEFDRYVSFGHPDEDFDFNWECGECGHENTLHVKALPMMSMKDLSWLFEKD